MRPLQRLHPENYEKLYTVTDEKEDNHCHNGLK